MTLNALCPSPKALQRLGADSLDLSAFRELEAHLAACPSCRELLDRLARADGTEAGPRVPTPIQRPTIPGCLLGAELGRGGCGVVYEAEQRTLKRRVAVKVLAGAPELDSRARQRWLREAQAAAKVRHPNVVRLHDAGENEGQLYLVFDLVPGGCLRDIARGPIPPADASRIVETIARAVEAIHREGLLHLDIKPANILMDGPPGASLDTLSPMLSDFGIAREASEEIGATRTLGGRGTPSYMAPEQVAGDPGAIGPTADVFALGATLYALLTGRPPFHGTTVIETLDLLRTTEPPPPRALAPNVPRDLETICLKALQKSPARRYGSALALADDLSRWRDGRPILARPVSSTERAARWCRQHPAPVFLAMTLALTVVLALASLTALWRHADRQRGRAEAALSQALRSDESADRLADDLTAMLRKTIEAPERFVSEHSADATDSILDLTAELRRDPERVVKHAVTIALLELSLATFRYARTDFEGTARLLDDAAELLALRFQAQPDSDTGARLVDATLRRAELSVIRGHHVQAAADIQRAASILRTIPDGPLARNELVDLHVMHRYLVDYLDSQGWSAEARRLSREHADDLTAMARRFPGSPAIALVARFASEEASAESPPPTTDWTREAFARFPKGEGMPRRLEVLLADLNARDLERIVAADSTDPRSVAAAMLSEYDRRCAASEVSPRFRAETIECLSQIGCVAVTKARRAGRFDEARRRIDWMIALGGMLSARAEVLGSGHVMAGRAHEQEAKLGWAVNDLNAVERGLRAALVEASRAFDEAPDERAPRVLLAAIREKFARFAAAEPEHPRPSQASR